MNIGWKILNKILANCIQEYIKTIYQNQSFFHLRDAELCTTTNAIQFNAERALDKVKCVDMRKIPESGIMAHTYNSSMWEAKTE